MDTMQQPPSDLPDLPLGTYEYLDTKKKKKWIIISEIAAVLVIAAVPAILSLFKIDYPLERVYEVVNPAYVGTLPANQNWKSVINSTKEFVQSATETVSKNINSSFNNEKTEQNLNITITPSPTIQTQQNQAQQEVAPTSSPDISTSSPTATNTPISTLTPTLTPTSTPTPTAQAEQNNQDQQLDEAVYACFGKSYNSHCSYFSSNGQKVEGKCKISSGGYLICVKGG